MKMTRYNGLRATMAEVHSPMLPEGSDCPAKYFTFAESSTRTLPPWSRPIKYLHGSFHGYRCSLTHFLCSAATIWITLHPIVYHSTRMISQDNTSRTMTSFWGISMDQVSQGSVCFKMFLLPWTLFGRYYGVVVLFVMWNGVQNVRCCAPIASSFGL